MKDSSRIRRATTPEQKTQIAIMVSAYANLLAIAGRFENMEEVLLDTVESWRAAVEPGSPLLAKVLVQVGSYYVETKQYARAEKLLKEALELCRGRDDAYYYRDIGIVLYIRAVARQDDRTPEHLERRRQLVRYVGELLEPDSDLLGRLMADFAGFMCERGDPDSALDYALRSLAILPDEDRFQSYVNAAIDAIECVAKCSGKEQRAMLPLGELWKAPRDPALHERIRTLLGNP